MTVASKIMNFMMPARWHGHDLDARIKSAMSGGEQVRAKVQDIVATAQAEEADANELTESVRARLTKLDERRESRAQDPRVSVVIQTIRIMEPKR